MVAYRDDATEPEGAALGGDDQMPVESSDIYRMFAAARAAIMIDFSRRLATATPTSRRTIKEQRASAMAAAKARMKAEKGGRKRRRKDRKATPRLAKN
jgi:hypothetical protein